MQDLVDTCRELEAQQWNLDDAHLLNAAGKENLGGGVKVGITVTMNNARVAFEARSGPSYEQCNISGGNLVAIDDVGADTNPIEPTAFTQIVLANSSSATLSEQAAIQYASFNGGVSYDSTSPYSGTDYPVGTPQEPVNNVYDAADIAAERGFTVGFLLSDMTIPTDLPLAGFTFLGSGKDRTVVTIPDAADVSECTYIDCEVTGYLDGNNTLRDCLIVSLNYIKGYIEQCVISPGTITLAGAEIAHFLDCYSGQPGVGTPTIDCGGSGQELAIRNFNGGIKLTNKSGADNISIDLNSGQVALDNTVTAGNIVVRGVGKLVDTNGDHIHSGTWNGATILNETVNAVEITEHVWETPVGAVVAGSYGEVIKAHAFHDETIYVDVNNGTPGTAYPLGTMNHPTNSIADALVIGATEGLRRIAVAEDITIGATDNVDGYLIQGAHATKSQITVVAGASTEFTQFSTCYLLGALDGWVVVRDSMIEDLSGVEGIFHEVMINPGTLELAGARESHFLSCYSGVPGPNTPEVDFGGSGRTCAFRNYNGGIKFTNKSGSEAVSVDLNSGQCILDGTVTAGTIVVRGVGKLVDGADADIPTGAWNGVTVLNETISDYTLAAANLLTVPKFIGLK
jgi:hypothetical protein